MHSSYFEFFKDVAILESDFTTFGLVKDLYTQAELCRKQAQTDNQLCLLLYLGDDLVGVLNIVAGSNRACVILRSLLLSEDILE